MKKSLLLMVAFSAAAVAGLCAAVSSMVVVKASAVREILVSAWCWVVDVLFAPLAKLEHKVVRLVEVELVAARSYLARQMRRERPMVSSRWRMVPSA